MAPYNIGPKIGIDGEAEFRKQIKEINSTYKVLEAQTKAVAAAFDTTGDEQTKLEKSAEILQQQLQQLKTKEDLLNDAVDKANTKFGENSLEAQRLRAALYDTQATILGLEKELSDTEERLESAGEEMEDFSNDTEDAGEATLDFGDVLKANLLSDAIMSGLDKLGDLVKDFASGMIDAAAEVRAENSQFAQTFGDLAAEATDSLEEISDATNISATRMQSSYTMIYAFAKTAGAESEAALDIATRAINAAADSAAYYDKSLEDVTETLQSFLKGNYENDAALGISATETTRNTAANEKYAKSFQDLTEAQKVDVLLSMVEAGNKASGAFGQAARESDEWTNVTGELEEAWRQLQAAVGEPFLEKLIPVVVKITDKLQEAAESGALEELAENLANGLGWLIDNGDDVVRSAAAIAAAIGGFKVASAAYSGVMDLKRALAEMSNLGGALTKMIATSASGATIIGGAAAAVTALVAAIVMAPQPVDETREAIDALNASAQEAAQAISAADQAFAADQSDIQNRIAVAEEYIQALEALEAQGVDTAEEQEDYNSAVAALQELLPDVNIQLDEQTGLLEGGTDALRDQIDQWEKLAYAQAYQQRLQETIAAKMDAELALEQQKKMLQELTPEYEAACEELKRLMQAYGNSGEAAMSFHGATSQATDEIAAAASEVGRLKTGITELEKGIEENKTAISDADEAMAGYKRQMKEFSDAAGGAAGATELLSGAVQDTDKTGFGHLSQEYKDLRTAAEGSIRHQIGLFEDLSDQVAPTFDEILQALQSQEEAFSNYADNLRLAMERGIDEGLVGQLSDGSVKSMLILQTLVNGTDEQIDELNLALGRVSEGRDKAAGAIADLKAQVINQVQDTVDRMKTLAADAVDGLVNGIKKNQHKFVKAMDNLAVAGTQKFQAHYIINSPSKLMEEMAGWIPAGAANGVEKNADEFAEAMEAMSEDPFAEAVQRFEESVNNTASTINGTRLSDYVEGAGWRLSAAAGVVTNNTTSSRVINLGGISVYVNATEDMDIHELARLVGQEINDSAIREVAAYG